MKLVNLALYRACLFIISLTAITLTPLMAASTSTEETISYQSSFDNYKPFVDENLADWKTVNAQSNGSGHAGHSIAGMKHEMSAEQKATMSMDADMPAMTGMDHSEMKEMNHEAMKVMPGNADKPAMKGMDHEYPKIVEPSTKPATEAVSQTSQFQIIPNFHPIAVHFPIALTLIAFLFSLAAYVLRSHALAPQLTATGHFTLWLAAVTAAIAVLFGWLAFNSVNHDDAGHAAMLLHRAWAIPTAIGLILLACWDAWKHRVNTLMSMPAIVLLFLLSGAIAVTGWLGGEVVYRHGIGVLSLPDIEGAGNSKNHGHAGAEAAEHSHATPETEPDEQTEHHHDDEKGESHEH